jgi:hypothetical protein
LEYLNAFWKYSSWEVAYAHVTNGAKLGFRLDEFDAVITTYCVRLCFEDHVSAEYLEQLERFRGVKILIIQDEYERTNIQRAWIKRLGFHVILTCVPQESISYVYPPEFSEGAEFITVLSGYAPEEIPKNRKTIPLAQRSIVVGYRGRDIGGRYGRLGFEKLEIARCMREFCEARGIVHDIECSEEKRIYGRAWYEFLASCRVVLGSESGCNVFDFDGSLERSYNEMSKARGGDLVSYHEFRHLTDHRENEVNMGQISPRMFEAASVGTPMLLFEGRYSNVIEPWNHYIPLSKDFSNVEQVLLKINDLDFLTGLASRAYDHLIVSGRFSYGAFIQQVDTILDRIQMKNYGFARDGLGMVMHLSPGKPPLQEEYPTDAPRSLDYFHLKQEQRQRIASEYLVEYLRKVLNSEVKYLRELLTSEMPLPRRLWRLLPRALRYRISNLLLGGRVDGATKLPFARTLSRWLPVSFPGCQASAWRESQRRDKL